MIIDIQGPSNSLAIDSHFLGPNQPLVSWDPVLYLISWSPDIDVLLPGAQPLNQAIDFLGPSPLPLISWFPAFDFLGSLVAAWGPAIAFPSHGPNH